MSEDSIDVEQLTIAQRVRAEIDHAVANRRPSPTPEEVEQINAWLHSIPLRERPMTEEERAGFDKLEKRAQANHDPRGTEATNMLFKLLVAMPISNEQRWRAWALFREAKAAEPRFEAMRALMDLQDTDDPETAILRTLYDIENEWGEHALWAARWPTIVERIKVRP